MAQALSAKYQLVVWWSAPVEMRGAFGRLLRMGQLTPNQQTGAQIRLEALRRTWREVLPSQEVLNRAESLVDRFPLTAADTLQLAAAWAWCDGHPHNRTIISNDKRLLDAARQLGFTGIEP